MPLLECVPNVSEGRDTAAIDHLADGLAAVSGARLLDIHSDPVHHRSVFTLVGERDALVTAVATLCERAVSIVDLRRHQGAHPRMGAVDVVPFVPFGTSTMADAVEAARQAARQVADRVGVPVYFYEAAASAPHRRRLEDVRRGQFEGLAAKMANAGWAPDIGRREPHPTAGAVAIGARPILVAFNVNLATDRLAIGRQVARTVRASGGGLACVKAMALSLPGRGLVQVSMNLIDYRVTSLPDAFAAVEREARRLGIEVAESELVGLMPAAALAGASAASLRIAGWHPGKLLETHVALP